MKRITFINKYVDSNNVARSTHQERRQINERNREYRGSKRSQKAEVRAEGCRDTASTSITRRMPLHPEGSDIATHRTSRTNGVYTTSSLDQQASNGIVLAGPGNAADPFDAASVPINSSVVRLLRYYKEVYYTTLWDKVFTVLDGKVDKEGIVRCSPEQVILECMENQSRMNSLLADVGCHLSIEDGIEPAVNSLQLLQRGTASLRLEFKSKGSNVNCDILLDALHLYLAAVALNQKDAMQAHLTGIKAIIKRMIQQGMHISTSRAGMLALVDPELSHQVFSLHPAEEVKKVEHLTTSLQRQDMSFEGIQALPPGSRP